VKALRPVKTESDDKLLPGKKRTPFVIKHEAVGLYAVKNAAVIGTVLFLKVYDFAESVKTVKRRFAAMPGKTDSLIAGSFDMPPDINLQQVVRQASFAGPVVRQVITVAAAQIAVSSPDFYKYLKIIHIRHFMRRRFVWQ
jgi:hypothetical protein